MLRINEKCVPHQLGDRIDYILENDVGLYSIDWNGEKYINGFNIEKNKITNKTYTPIRKFEVENIDISDIEENSEEWFELMEIAGFEEGI